MRNRRIVAAVGAGLLLVAAGAAALLYATSRRDVTTSSAEAARVYREAIDNERCFYFKEARLGFARALELDPDFAEAMLGLARLAGDWEGNDGQGSTLIRRAARLKDSLSERERLHVDMALAQTEKRRDDALKIAVQTHLRYPEDVRAAMFLAGDALVKGNSEGAVKIFQDLLATNPNNPDAYNQIGYYYAFRGETDRALEYLKKYQFMLPESANPYDSLGEVQANSGRYEEAIANLNKALRVKADFFESWGHLGVAYEGKGEPARAIAAYLKAAELADNDGKRADYLMGALRTAVLINDKAAVEDIGGRLTKLPKMMYTEVGKEFLSSTRELVSGRLAEAERHLKDAKAKWDAVASQEQLMPGRTRDWPAWNFLASLVKLRARKDAEALPLLETLANPPNPWGNFGGRRFVYEGRALLAALVARQGDLDRAEKLLEENRKWNPSWAPTRESELAVAQLRREKVLAATK
jgi:tetratricopeptide (TPR) repeat protein